MFQHTLEKESILKIGKVKSVDGRTVTILVDKSKNSSHLLFKGELLRNVSVGGYVKITKGFTRIIGKVEGEFTYEDRNYGKREYKSRKEKIIRELKISLLGFFFDGKFNRGVKELPLVDNECFLIDQEEFNQVHHFVSDGDDPLAFGTLALEKGQSIAIGVNSLFASHIGIFGNTGSGKSYTLARIYQELFNRYLPQKNFVKRTQFFLLDFNGEYISDDVIVERKYKNIFDLSTFTANGDRFPIAIDAVRESTFWAIFLTATERTQAPFLDRALRSQEFSQHFDSEDSFRAVIEGILRRILLSSTRTPDRSFHSTFLRELINALWNKQEGLRELLTDYESHIKWHARDGYYYYERGNEKRYPNQDDFAQRVIVNKLANVNINAEALTLLDKIRLKIIFKYFDEVLLNISSTENIGPLIGRLRRRANDLAKVIEVYEPDGGEPEHLSRNITVLSLRNVNINMKKVLPLLICKQLYEEKKNSDDGTTYLNLIIDEAHNVLEDVCV
jgi:uncharacterized protein